MTTHIIKTTIIVILIVINYHLLDEDLYLAIFAAIGTVILVGIGNLREFSEYEEIIERREQQLRQRDQVIANLKRKLETKNKK